MAYLSNFYGKWRMSDKEEDLIFDDLKTMWGKWDKTWINQNITPNPRTYEGNEKMLTPRKAIEALRKELPHLGSSYGVKRMALFGSFAKGVPREDSDIDLLVEFEKPIGLKFMDFAEHKEQSRYVWRGDI